MSGGSGELVEVAGLARRAAARFIDVLCMLGLCALAWLATTIPFAIVIIAFAEQVDPLGPGGGGITMLWIWSLVGLAVVLVYRYEVVSTARRGQTFGKRYMGICVIHRRDPESGVLEPPRHEASMRRWALPHGVAVAVAILSVVVVVAAEEAEWTDREFFLLFGGLWAFAVAMWAACYLSVLFGLQRRGWHDKVAGTAVICATDEVLKRLSEPKPAAREPGPSGGGAGERSERAPSD